MPTELEKELYEALGIVLDEFLVPLETTRGGLTVVRFSPEQVAKIRQASTAFETVHGQRLSLGKYVSTTKELKP